MTNDELAALDRAATWVGKKPLVLECVENGVWQIRLIFGEGEKNCTTMRQWSDAYRANQLVLIGTDSAEVVVRAMRFWTTGECDMRGRFWVHGPHYRKDFSESDDAHAHVKHMNATAALAALGVK